MHRSKIYISPIAWMSLKMGTRRAKTRSRRPKRSNIGNYLLNMRNIWKTVPDSQTIRPTIEQNVQFKGGIWPKKIQLDQIEMADLWPLFTLIYVISARYM